MAKSRTLNEIRQSKEFQTAKETVLSDQGGKYTVPYKGADPVPVKSRTVDTLGRTDVAVDEIVDTLTTHMFDIIFEAVNDEMHKYTVFQEQTYLTDEGMDMFEEQWFEFYHEHHGEILGRIMKTLTN
jgi:hypothetical protein